MRRQTARYHRMWRSSVCPRAACWACIGVLTNGRAIAQRADGQVPADWVAEIEKIFIRSEDCKQCHDRHYEEWKGAREQTPDLKTFGRVDAALLHGTSLESPVFRTVLGLWLQTIRRPTSGRRCLSCHVPSVTVFPQHADKISGAGACPASRKWKASAAPPAT